MRRIDLKAPETQKWKRWLRDCEAEAKLVAEALAQGEKPSFKESLYRRKSIKEEWFFNGKEPFHDKCAYCEALITSNQRGDVEHFRPKGAVADEHDEPVVQRDEEGRILCDDKGRPRPHPGYHWLAYDWTNLLPACILCNQASTIEDEKIGKHTRFPVAGRHAWGPEDLTTEEPLLIHPGSGEPKDDPELHFSMDPDTGVMSGETDRGRMCIQIFGLNLRGLPTDRRKATREVKSLVSEFLYNRARRAEVVEELASIKAGKQPFTMAQKAAFSDLRPLVRELLED